MVDRDDALRAAGGDGGLRGRDDGRKNGQALHIRHRHGNEDVITADHMKAMKPMRCLNIGHFDSETNRRARHYAWRK